jgi:hypothetical protein
LERLNKADIPEMVELLKVVVLCAQPTVSNFLVMQKEVLPNTKKLFQMAQTLTDLTEEETAAIAYVSVIFGGTVWTGMSKMFDNLSGAVLDNVIVLFGALL